MPELEIFQNNLRPMEYWHHRAMQKVASWKEGKPDGLSTGFPTLDMWSRLIGTELIIIAGRPSQGKTQIAMQMVESVARHLKSSGERGCVAVFSAEMSGWDLHLRCAAALSGVNTHLMRNGRGTPEDFTRLEVAAGELRNLPIWIDDNSGPTTSQMLSQLRTINEDIPVRMMMFDFMELGGDRGNVENLRVGQICHNLKGIAKTLNIPVLALSQLSREVEGRPSKIPTLSDLRQSGMIEQLADVVMFVMRPEYYVERMLPIDAPDEDKKGVAYCMYAKNRNGPVGLAKLAFIKDRVLFAELERNPLPGVRR